MKKSHLESSFEIWLKINKLDHLFEREYKIPKPQRLLKSRKASWRIDFAAPLHKVGIEINGGTYSAKGRHSTGTGQHADYDKLNYLTANGWKMFVFDALHVREADYIILQDAINIIRMTTKGYDNESAKEPLGAVKF